MEFRVAFELVTARQVDDLSQDFYTRFDGLLSEIAGRVVASVFAEGSHPVDASIAMIGRLETELGVSVVRIDHDLVDGPEIASRLGVTRQAVNGWATGTRGGGFPFPMGSPGGKKMWAWSDVVDWAIQHRQLDEDRQLSRDDAAMVDAYLAVRRRKAAAGSMPMTWAIGANASKGSTRRPSSRLSAPSVH